MAVIDLKCLHLHSEVPLFTDFCVTRGRGWTTIGIHFPAAAVRMESAHKAALGKFSYRYCVAYSLKRKSGAIGNQKVDEEDQSAHPTTILVAENEIWNFAQQW